jgi:uncharacterized membrane protein
MCLIYLASAKVTEFHTTDVYYLVAVVIVVVMAEIQEMRGGETERQYTCNVTVRSIHATIVAVEKQKVVHTLSLCL